MLDRIPLTLKPEAGASTRILGKDLPLEQTIANMSGLWPNWAPDRRFLAQHHSQCVVATYPRCAFADVLHQRQRKPRKALASALGEHLERISNNHFYAGSYWGEEIANADFVHLPQRALVQARAATSRPRKSWIYCLEIYNPDGELRASHLVDTNSGNVERGICSLPYVRQSMVKCILQPVENPS
jgi:ribosomal protein S12 methylthiotransferase accessory factor